MIVWAMNVKNDGYRKRRPRQRDEEPGRKPVEACLLMCVGGRNTSMACLTINLKKETSGLDASGNEEHRTVNARGRKGEWAEWPRVSVD